MLSPKIAYFRPTGFDPRSISGLAAWYDASSAETLFTATSGGSAVAGGGAVARWEDRSGNGFHLGQATANNRPLRITSAINGRDVLRFDGSNDFIERATTSSSMAGSPFSVLSGATMFMVLRRAANNNAGAHGTRSNSATNHHPFGTSYFDSFASSDRKSWAQAYNANLHLYGVVASSSAWTAFQNGSQIFTTSSITLTALRHISFPDNGSPAAMDLCEAVFYSRDLSASERISVQNYLNSRWAIY